MPRPKFSDWMKQHSDFVTFLKRHSKTTLKPKTIHNQLGILKALSGDKYKLELNKPDALAVLGRMEKGDIAATTSNAYKDVLRKWLLFKHKKITKAIDEALKKKQGERRRVLHPRDLLSYEEVLDIVEHTQSLALRAFYAALYDTGARPSALASLNLCDVTQDVHGYVFHINQAKTEQSKRSVRLLNPTTIKHFEVWYSAHPMKGELDAPLFINRTGRRLNIRSLSVNIKKTHNERLGRVNGKGKAQVSLYLFRKSRATNLLKEKRLSPIEIKTRLGHKQHSMMLEQYYAILDEVDQAGAELAYMGVSDEVEDASIPQPIFCPNCGAPNETDSLRCVRCKLPMSEDKAIQVQKAAVESFQSLLSDPETLKASFESLLSDPDVLSLLASAVADSLVQEREKQASSIAETSPENPI